MDLRCYVAASPDAEDASQLYSEAIDSGAFWERTNQSVPLPTCSSPDAPDSRCDACSRDRQVYVFCRRLLEKLELVMEATGSRSIALEEIDCPVFPPDSPTDSPTDPPEQPPTFSTGLVTIIIIAVLLLFLVVVAAGVLLYRKRGNEHEVVRSEEGDGASPISETVMDD